MDSGITKMKWVYELFASLLFRQPQEKEDDDELNEDKDIQEPSEEEIENSSQSEAEVVNSEEDIENEDIKSVQKSSIEKLMSLVSESDSEEEEEEEEEETKKLEEKKEDKKNSFYAIQTEYNNLEEVQEALRKAGLESSQLIIGIDFTKSNTWNGKNSFNGLSLHHIDPFQKIKNPYQEVISIIGRTLESFDDDNYIPAFGFGDFKTKDKDVFPFYNDHLCHGFQEVLDRYCQIIPMIKLSGPTSFAPLINEAINIVKVEKTYHILLIICDGQIDSVSKTIETICEASNYPISIITIGVGDGPWELMKQFDNELPERKFDNFNFVLYEDIKNSQNRDVDFSIAALKEIPEQFQMIKKLGILENISN